MPVCYGSRATGPLTNKKALAVYYTVIKHEGLLTTRGKCKKHELHASVFYISRMFSNVRSVSSKCKTWLRLQHLLYDIVFTRAKQQNAFPMFYTLSQKTTTGDI